MKYVLMCLVCSLTADCLITAETDEAECDDAIRKSRAGDENVAFHMYTTHCKISCWRAELRDSLQR